MGNSFIRKISLTFLFCLFLKSGITQPYVDIINASVQSVQSNFKNAAKGQKTTNNYFFNLTVPIKVDSQNTIIVRFYAEELSSHLSGTYAANFNIVDRTSNLYSTLLPIGLQHETKNKRWKLLGLVMPKLSSDFKDKISAYDFQLGGYGLATYSHNNNLKIKAGLFYNREFFGNFFVPLVGIDWRASERLQFYGVLPTFYRIEYAAIKKKLYTGFEFRSYTRSYRLDEANSHNYIKNAEIKAKLFVDFYIKQKLVLFADFGRTIGYSPQEYMYGTKIKTDINPIYTGIKDAFFFNVGLAYRIRFDFK